MVVYKMVLFLWKTVMRNTQFWVWSILFMLFWAAMGAYVFSRNITKERLIASGVPEFMVDKVWSNVVKSYTSGWLAAIIAVSYAAIAGVLVGYVYYSTIPVRYLSRFSRITTTKFMYSNIAGALLVCLVSYAVIYLASYLMFKHRFGVDMIPENPLGVVVASLVYGTVVYLLSTVLALTAVLARKPGLVEKLSYAPLTLGVAFIMLSIHVGGEHFYLTPFNSAMALVYYYSSGFKPPLDEPLAFARGDYTPLEPIHAWTVLLGWLAALLTLSIVLYEKQKGIPVEELVS